MNNQLNDDINNSDIDTFNDVFEDEIRQSYHELSENLPLPPSNSFSRIMDQIHIEENKQNKESRKFLLSRIIEFFRGNIIVPKLGWALAGAQFAVILFLFFTTNGPNINSFNTLSINTATDKSIEINIIFKDNALQKEIRELLTGSGATIINGPTETGLYILKIKQEHDIATQLKNFKNSKIVKFVSKRY